MRTNKAQDKLLTILLVEDNTDHADLIIRERDMIPVAVRTHSPNAQNQTVFTFENQRIDPFKWNPLARDYHVATPLGWQREVQDPPPAPRRQAAAAGRKAR